MLPTPDTTLLLFAAMLLLDVFDVLRAYFTLRQHAPRCRHIRQVFIRAMLDFRR